MSTKQELQNSVQFYLDLTHEASLKMLSRIINCQELTGEERSVMLLEVSSAHARLVDFLQSRISTGAKKSTTEILQQIDFGSRLQ